MSLWLRWWWLKVSLKVSLFSSSLMSTSHSSCGGVRLLLK